MTKVAYDRAELYLSMEGHAGAGEKGDDLVCAALSMLMMTLERRMLDRAEQTAVTRAPGRFSIRCEAAPEREALCRESFDTVAAGLALLTENRPEHVSLTLTGEDVEQEDEQ